MSTGIVQIEARRSFRCLVGPFSSLVPPALQPTKGPPGRAFRKRHLPEWSPRSSDRRDLPDRHQGARIPCIVQLCTPIEQLSGAFLKGSAGHSRLGLDEFVLQGHQRRFADRLRQGQGPHEVRRVVGEDEQLWAYLVGSRAGSFATPLMAPCDLARRARWPRACR